MRKIVILGCNDKTRALVPLLVKDSSICPEICIASRDKAACDEIKHKYAGSPVRVSTARVDLANEAGTKMMLSITQPDMIVHLTEPRYSSTIMKLALEMGAAYIDCALDNSDNSDLLAKQFEMFGDFRSKGITAITGCGFNPGVITSYIRSLLGFDFDSITDADLFDVEALASRKYSLKEIFKADEGNGEAGKASVIASSEYKEVDSLSEKIDVEISADKTKTLYLMNNSIVEDFSKELPEFPNVRYFAPYAKPDSSVLDKFRPTGMLSTEPIEIEGVKIAPIDFLEKVIESAGGLSQDDVEGEADDEIGSGVIVKGKRGGKDKSVMAYIGGSEKDYKKKYGVGFRAYADGIAMFAGIKLIARGKWRKAGVFTPCAFDASLMVTELHKEGFDYKEKII